MKCLITSSASCHHPAGQLSVFIQHIAHGFVALARTKASSDEQPMEARPLEVLGPHGSLFCHLKSKVALFPGYGTLELLQQDIKGHRNFCVPLGWSITPSLRQKKRNLTPKIQFDEEPKPLEPCPVLSPQQTSAEHINSTGLLTPAKVRSLLHGMQYGGKMTGSCYHE